VLSKLFERRGSPENPQTSLANPDTWLYAALGAQYSSAGVAVSEQSAMGLTAVFACINILSSAIGQLPCNLYRTSGGIKELDKSNPTFKLLRYEPNSEMTAFTFFQTMQAAAAGWGNAYALINWRRNGYPGELLPLSSATTAPRRVDGQLVYDIDRNGRRVTVLAKDIIHVKSMSYDGIIGLSPIRTQRELVGAGLAQQTFVNQFYANGATPSGALTFPGKIMDTEKLRNEWQLAHTGENRSKVAVLENGMKYEQISIDPVDAQYVDSTKMNATQVASIFRVPPHMINVLDRATWGNVESLGLEFVVHTLGSWFIAWQQELERKLFSPRERFGLEIRFDPRALMKGDHKSRAMYYKSGVVDGWMTRNEVRALEDMNPLEGLDEPLQPLNMMGVEDADDIAEATAEALEIANNAADAASDSESDPSADPEDLADSAARAAFNAVVTRLYLQEKRWMHEVLAGDWANVEPRRKIIEKYKEVSDHLVAMFGCNESKAQAFAKRRVFALVTLSTVKSAQDWINDAVSRKAEIEESFR